MTTPEIPKVGGAAEQPVDKKIEQEQPVAKIPEVQEQAVPQTPPPATVQPADDQTQQPVQDDTVQTVTITVPATPQQLDDWAKGDPEESITWFAFYWIRMIKKALLHGYRVITQIPNLQNA